MNVLLKFGSSIIRINTNSDLKAPCRIEYMRFNFVRSNQWGGCQSKNLTFFSLEHLKITLMIIKFKFQEEFNYYNTFCN
jgi:hypothetical protein